MYISEVAIAEFYSTTTKKLRMNEIDLEQAYELIRLLEADIEKYKVVKIDSNLLDQAKKLVLQYRQEGLRTLDAIQLVSATTVGDDIAFSKTLDDKQAAAMKLEGLKIM